MAIATIAHKPHMTKDELQQLFAGRFGAEYRVDVFNGPFRDFVIIKNPFVGVGVKLEQRQNETKINYVGMCPSWWARMLLGPLIGVFLWNGMTSEVKEFIAAAPEFQSWR